MSTIDLIVLGMLKQEPLSAYEIQKLVEYRNISRWVKVSTPSIYKKVIQLEKKGYIIGCMTKEGKMPEKAVYSLTPEGENRFEELMLQISGKPINIFLDFNAVVVNLQSLSVENQQKCLASIRENIQIMKSNVLANLEQKKDLADIPATGLAVLQQQLMLAEAVEKWIDSLM